eukprot:3553549-Prymnesium_polylepis.1
MQRRTSRSILRPYPHGLRFSGRNMSPIPGWLAGAQCVAYAIRIEPKTRAVGCIWRSVLSAESSVRPPTAGST